MHDISFFREELALIEDIDLRAMTEAALGDVPAWFWTEPASLTGRHHPPDDLEEGGFCVHSRKVAWLARRFFEVMDQDTDVGVSAALLHDIRSRGAGDEVGTMEEYKIHGKAAADYLWKSGQEELSWGYGAAIRPKWYSVCACVETHMGKYGGSLPTELDQQLLHLADVAASFRLLVGLPFYTDDIPPLPDIMESGKRFVERGGVLLVNFGNKHFRKDVNDVMAKNPGYFDWMIKPSTGFPEDVVSQVKDIQKRYREEQKKQAEVESGNLPLF